MLSSTLAGWPHLFLLHIFLFFPGVPSLCSPLAVLQSVPVSPGEELVHMSGALVFVAATQGTPLGYLALEARGAGILGPMGL